MSLLGGAAAALGNRRGYFRGRWTGAIKGGNLLRFS
jgi:hypothetical protein